jgi:hypothetical protein
MKDSMHALLRRLEREELSMEELDSDDRSRLSELVRMKKARPSMLGSYSGRRYYTAVKRKT